MKKLFGEFKDFIARGNVMDMAIGVIIGGAFMAIVNSLVNDIINPFIKLISGGGTEVSGLFDYCRHRLFAGKSYQQVHEEQKRIHGLSHPGLPTLP